MPSGTLTIQNLCGPTVCSLPKSDPCFQRKRTTPHDMPSRQVRPRASVLGFPFAPALGVNGQSLRARGPQDARFSRVGVGAGPEGSAPLRLRDRPSQRLKAKSQSPDTPIPAIQLFDFLVLRRFLEIAAPGPNYLVLEHAILEPNDGPTEA